MSVDRATVHRIARLARIAITDEEAVKLEAELSGILDWVAQLDELDTENVEPMTCVEAMKMKMREDDVTDGFKADAVVKNAPQADDHYFVVPKIVE
ncbi:MAG: Asp-tRNA(Asn)/Glu-tRNA(Gln) amidotransferase subunit GatC [Pseudomonadota bacterium]